MRLIIISYMLLLVFFSTLNILPILHMICTCQKIDNLTKKQNEPLKWANITKKQMYFLKTGSIETKKPLVRHKVFTISNSKLTGNVLCPSFLILRHKLRELR